MAVDEQKLRATTDAQVWAQEFMAEFGPRLPDIDEGLMIGWFANAMAVAELAALAAHPERTPVEDQDFVVLPRAALFEFFGYMALPPWTDENGASIGNGIDCAPLASQITEWVTAHDLGDLYRVSDFGGPS